MDNSDRPFFIPALIRLRGDGCHYICIYAIFYDKYTILPMYLFATLLGSIRLHLLTTVYGECPVCSPHYSVDSVGVDDLGFIDRSS